MESPIQPFLNLGAEIVFYLAFLAFIVHLFILAFHWLSYGGSKRKNITAILLYSIGGSTLLLLLYALLGMLP